MPISSLGISIAASFTASSSASRSGTASASEAAETPQTTADYLKRLQSLNPDLDITIGPNPRQGTRKNTVGISEKYLQKCLADPAEAAKFEQSLSTQMDAVRQKDAWAARDGIEIIGGGLRIDDDGGWSSGYDGQYVTKQSGQSSGGAVYTPTAAKKKSTDPSDRLALQTEKRRQEQKALKAKQEKAERQEALEEKREAKRQEQRELLERLATSADPAAAPGEIVDRLA